MDHRYPYKTSDHWCRFFFWSTVVVNPVYAFLGLGWVAGWLSLVSMNSVIVSNWVGATNNYSLDISVFLDKYALPRVALSHRSDSWLAVHVPIELNVSSLTRMGIRTNLLLLFIRHDAYYSSNMATTSHTVSYL